MAATPRSLSPSIAHDPRVARVIALYEALNRASLDQLGEVYASDARFKDPFNEVRGLASIRIIFEHLLAQDEQPRFVVTDAAVQGSSAFLVWDFHCRTRQRSTPNIQIHGASVLRFDAHGRVANHRDYWDAAEEVYAKLPGLGVLMRWLQRRAKVDVTSATLDGVHISQTP